MEDKRFKHIATDPKFRRIPKREKKVKIDKRFQSMFKDKKFKIKYTTDKRGRPISHTSTEDLKRYYELGSGSSSEESSEEEEQPKLQPEDDVKEDEINELDVKDELDKSVSNKARKKLKNLSVDYARGESKLCSESSSDDEDDESQGESESEDIEHKWGELDADAERTEDATYRLAACNMDWDRIKAVDLMVLFNSFLPSGGAIKSVAIYPSEFGKQRMEEEEVKGPTELVESTKNDVEDDNEQGSEYHMEKLRKYQLNRLKYYYAVITFDCANSANKIYTECDGMEYESSAIKLDLRFVPDDMTFEDDPKDFCDKLPEVNKYQPRFFTTTALQQAKVDLTWDETNPDRIEFAQKLSKNKEELSEADLRNYLASSSGSEDESDNEGSDNKSQDGDDVDAVDKYKALLQSIEEKEREKKEKDDVQMEISWGINLKETAEKKMKERLESKDKTPFEKYLEKRKEKRKQKRNKAKSGENSVSSDGDDQSDVPSDIDLNDPYFAEEFNKPEFKKTDKNKNSKKEATAAAGESAQDQGEAELELLLMNEEDKKHFSLKKIQESQTSGSKKKKSKKLGKDDNNDDFSVNVEDERFSALFTSHHYNIDPTDPHYKKTKGMETLINEKIKRRAQDDNLPHVSSDKKPKISKEKGELNLLVKSVKTKSKNFKN